MNGAGFLKNTLTINRNHQVLLQNKGSNKFQHFDRDQYAVTRKLLKEPLALKRVPNGYLNELRSDLIMANERIDRILNILLATMIGLGALLVFIVLNFKI